jgi:2-keto-4-pentenoate hydratase
VRAGVGGNTAVDPIRLIQWLANEGAHSLGGLREGSTITTGSCSGALLIAPGTVVAADFAGVGRATLSVAEAPSSKSRPSLR